MRLTLSALSEQLRAAVALIVIAVVAATVVIVVAVRHRPTPVSAPIHTDLTELVTPAPSLAAKVTVDVEGKVHRPGLVELPAGSRVSDAIKAAGGIQPGTSLAGLNLARKLVDGEQIIVGAPPLAATGISGGGSTATATIVNLNTATLEQLDSLPGVGPVMAKKIIDWRTAHGAFASVDQLREIEGIGAKTFERLKDLVAV